MNALFNLKLAWRGNQKKTCFLTDHHTYVGYSYQHQHRRI